MTSKYKVVITDWVMEISDAERNILREVGADVVAGKYKDTEEIIERAIDADVLLVDALPITRLVFDKLKKLKAVVRYGIGVDNVDIKAATEKGVQVVNIPDAMTIEVAEHTVGLLLAIVRKIPMADKLVKSGKWADPSTWAGSVPKIQGKTIGIVGLGRVGRTVANIMKCFNVVTIGYDPYLEREYIENLGIRSTRDLEELLRNSDFITVHIPLTGETRHLIGKKQFKLMRKGTFIVNCARGAIIDPKALHGALTSGRIAGAASDVFEKEPVDHEDPLLKLTNFIATPHMAYYSDEVSDKFRKLASEEAARVLRNEKPLNIVNPEVIVKK